MSTKTSTIEKSSSTRARDGPTIWAKAFTKSEWVDKDEFLDVVYWARQLLGILIGVAWGIVPLKGFIALFLFVAINCGIVYLYCINFQGVDEEAYGGVWELLKEGFMTSFACFLVTWIIFYTGLHYETLVKE
ncbi:GEL complex subunit OPTI [Phlebotomus argentipes]|uniref:GEL complex subunit OPTI n=1 Tax=Phlebotomus argentipes TaxID=94469 RepID=UPI002892EFE9|nr:GEL complex subunit OPTI [Phlebotomus argentipes]